MPTQVNRVFLSAQWRDLAMINYESDPSVLAPLLPAGTELDQWFGRTFVSLVGFRFVGVRVRGIPIPFHCNFEEINLRFYVRRKGPEGWRRGVAFVREIVPRRAIAWIARRRYGEPYVSFPTRHRVEESRAEQTAEYSWKRGGVWESIRVEAGGPLVVVREGSEEEFITEHYWGYTRLPDGCGEYRVDHPRWSVRIARSATLEADVASLYGPAFVEALEGKPASAWIADGSRVTVSVGSRHVIQPPDWLAPAQSSG